MRGVLCGLLQEGAQDRKHGIPRIADLQATPASMRLLSIEPRLEDLGTIDLQGISRVIVGGESGPGARPMKEGWVLSILEQCAAARIPFSFKQWGGVRKKATGRKLLGRTYDEFPKRVQHPMLPTRRRVHHISKIEDETRLAHNCAGAIPCLIDRQQSASQRGCSQSPIWGRIVKLPPSQAVE